MAKTRYGKAKCERLLNDDDVVVPEKDPAKKKAWPKFGFPKKWDPNGFRMMPIFCEGEVDRSWIVCDTPTLAAEAYDRHFEKELSEIRERRDKSSILSRMLKIKPITNEDLEAMIPTPQEEDAMVMAAANEIKAAIDKEMPVPPIPAVEEDPPKKKYKSYYKPKAQREAEAKAKLSSEGKTPVESLIHSVTGTGKLSYYTKTKIKLYAEENKMSFEDARQALGK